MSQFQGDSANDAAPTSVDENANVLKKDKGIKSIATKVGIQMAAKLGAEPWAVDIPLKECMVIGYDSYHDSSAKGRSVGAVISTINQVSTLSIDYCVIAFHCTIRVRFQEFWL